MPHDCQLESSQTLTIRPFVPGFTALALGPRHQGVTARRNLVALLDSMKHAMARQAEAEREKRATTASETADGSISHYQAVRGFAGGSRALLPLGLCLAGHGVLHAVEQRDQVSSCCHSLMTWAQRERRESGYKRPDGQSLRAFELAVVRHRAVR